MYRRTLLLKISGLMAGLVAVMGLVTTACSSGPEPEQDDDQFIGAPPSDDEDDPLFDHALPSEAVPADPSGRIGTATDDETDEPPVFDGDDDTEATDQLRDEITELEREIEQMEAELSSRDSELSTTRQQLSETEEQLAETEQRLDDARTSPGDDPDALSDVPDDQEVCFSCVRICPVDDSGQADCPPGSDDLLCGWGTHDDDADQAADIARAHCDSTLDMTRSMPDYGDIRGDCPAATCR